MRSRHRMRYLLLGDLLVLVLAIVPAASTDAFAVKWRGITEAENRIVFSGRHLDDYRALHYDRPFDEGNNPEERYRVQWKAGSRRLPVFSAHLHILPPGRYFPGSVQHNLDRYAKGLAWFKDKPLSTVETGTAGTVLGPADFLIFTADKHRCGVFLLYFNDSAISRPDALGNTRVDGLYCPVSGQVDAETLESLLSRVGVRGIAVPKMEEPQAGRRPALQRPSTDSLATLVATGDIKRLRRVAAKDFDPDTTIAFQHPRFANGRVIRRPILVAAALFGQTEIVVFLLNKGASTRGPSSGAICAAVARRHPKIVEVLLKKDPELTDYNRCGRSRDLSPIYLARRLNLRDIVHKLLETNSR